MIRFDFPVNSGGAFGCPCHPVTDEELSLARHDELEATSGRFRRFVVSGGLSRLYVGMCAVAMALLLSSIFAVHLYGAGAPIVFLTSYSVMVVCITAYDLDKSLDRRALLNRVYGRRLAGEDAAADHRTDGTAVPAGAPSGTEPVDAFTE